MKALVLTGLTLGLAAAGAGGWAAWNSTAIAQRDVAGSGLQVEVVAPQEPDLPVGAIMTVGDLSDGYVYDPDQLQPPAALDGDYDAYIDAAWVEPEPWVQPPVQSDSVLRLTSLRPPQPRLEPHDYSYGFDQPLPGPAEGDAGASAPNTPADTPPWDDRGLD